MAADVVLRPEEGGGEGGTRAGAVKLSPRPSSLPPRLVSFPRAIPCGHHALIGCGNRVVLAVGTVAFTSDVGYSHWKIMLYQVQKSNSDPRCVGDSVTRLRTRQRLGDDSSRTAEVALSESRHGKAKLNRHHSRCSIETTMNA